MHNLAKSQYNLYMKYSLFYKHCFSSSEQKYDLPGVEDKKLFIIGTVKKKSKSSIVELLMGYDTKVRNET